MCKRRIALPETCKHISSEACRNTSTELQAAIEKHNIEIATLGSKLVTEARKRSRVTGFLEKSQHETRGLLKDCETLARANKQLRIQMDTETELVAQLQVRLYGLL